MEKIGNNTHEIGKSNQKRRDGKMPNEIKTIITKKFRIKVNSYLLRTGSSYLLIDSGFSSMRSSLEKELKSAGCNPGNLKLIVLTHGDFDHTGNAAYFRKKFDTKIAMHCSDSGIVEHGDMFRNRKKVNFLIKLITNKLLGLNKSDRFKPDFCIEDGYDFSEFGFEAKVLHLPGHSKGSIGILTADGDLFCGDLLTNMDKPAPNSLIDDSTELETSIEKLKHLPIKTVYPGHGKPFQMELFMNEEVK